MAPARKFEKQSRQLSRQSCDNFRTDNKQKLLIADHKSDGGKEKSLPFTNTKLWKGDKHSGKIALTET